MSDTSNIQRIRYRHGVYLVSEDDGLCLPHDPAIEFLAGRMLTDYATARDLTPSSGVLVAKQDYGAHITYAMWFTGPDRSRDEWYESAYDTRLQLPPRPAGETLEGAEEVVTLSRDDVAAAYADFAEHSSNG